jgi:hypothetical protein
MNSNSELKKDEIKEKLVEFNKAVENEISQISSG